MFFKRMPWIIAGILAIGLVAGLAVAAFLFPWKQAIGERLQAALRAQGFEGVSLSVADVGLHKATLEDINLGGEPPLVLDTLEVHYSPGELRHLRMENAVLRGLSVEVRKIDGKWRVPGLEGLAGEAGAKKSFRIPVSAVEISFIPFESVALEDSTLRVIAPGWVGALPLQGKWERAPVPEIQLRSPGLEFAKGGLGIKTGAAESVVTLHEDAGEWRGTWLIKDVFISGAAVEIPPLAGEGTIQILPDKVIAEGAFKSADGAYRVSVMIEHAINDPARSYLEIRSMTMPWKGGTVGAKSAKLPLVRDKPVRIDVEVGKVSLDEILQSLTGKRVSATGDLSGIVPVLLKPDGGIAFLDGHLQAATPGSITMPPDAIPGDNEQVVLVRDILANLQYSVLSATTSSDESGKLAVLLSLEGNNPDVYDGRAVKLNVKLTGDLVDFVQQNLMLLTKPETLLERDSDEKN